MSRKRERLEIIHDILLAIQRCDKGKGVKPTHILYKSNLSHKMLMEYLAEMIGKGFVSEYAGKKGTTYSLTDKGCNYLKEFSVIKGFMESYGLE